MGLQQTVDAAIEAALVNRIVGCVVLVNQNGKEIYARTAGLADREANRKLERKLEQHRGQLMRAAVELDPRQLGVTPSTKGVL